MSKGSLVSQESDAVCWYSIISLIPRSLIQIHVFLSYDIVSCRVVSCRGVSYLIPSNHTLRRISLPINLRRRVSEPRRRNRRHRRTISPNFFQIPHKFSLKSATQISLFRIILSLFSSTSSLSLSSRLGFEKYATSSSPRSR